MAQEYKPEQTDSEEFHPAIDVYHRRESSHDEPTHVEPPHDNSPKHTQEREQEERRGEDEAYVPVVGEKARVDKEQEQKSTYSAWDASKYVISMNKNSLCSILIFTRAPPPTDSQPEAHSFPATQYAMSSDPTPWKAPERFPDPPKDMYYEVPKTPTYQKPAPIFPWEKHAAKPTRVFLEDDSFVDTSVTERPNSSSSSVATVDDEKPIPVTPAIPLLRITEADPWQTYSRGNAWDDIPEIERYIGNLQKNRKGNIQVLQGYGSGIEQVSSPGAVRRRSMKLTDFPTELERPSLPVTPAPIRRPTFWGNERNDEGELPQAEGVPSQADWVSLILYLPDTDLNLPKSGSSSTTGTISPATIRCTCQQAWKGGWSYSRDPESAITLWIRGGYLAHLRSTDLHEF